MSIVSFPKALRANYDSILAHRPESRTSSLKRSSFRSTSSRPRLRSFLSRFSHPRAFSSLIRNLQGQRLMLSSYRNSGVRFERIRHDMGRDDCLKYVSQFWKKAKGSNAGTSTVSFPVGQMKR